MTSDLRARRPGEPSLVCMVGVLTAKELPRFELEVAAGDNFSDFKADFGAS